MGNKALFLDRDGTINEEKHYLFKKEDFVFREGIFELVKAFKERGYLIFVVTNQSGIARGFFSENDYLKLTGWMQEQFSRQGVRISKVYHCPHLPEITGECLCRKPNPGMLLEAIREFNLEPTACVLIGDSVRDLEAGRRAGLRNVYKINPEGRINWSHVVIQQG